MGELAEEWREYKEYQKERKWNRYEKSKALLIEKGINFIEKDNGHFIIGNYDFWATTGLFIHRKTTKRGRGVENLIKKLEAPHE